MAADPIAFLVPQLDLTRRAFGAFIERALLRRGHKKVTASQALIVYFLGADGMRPADLHLRGFYGKSNISFDLTALRAKGYVVSRASKADARAIRLTPTQRGLKLQQDVGEILAATHKVAALPVDLMVGLRTLQSTWEGLFA